MLEFELLHIGFKGIGDDGFHKCDVRLGFYDQKLDQRAEVNVGLYLALDLNASLDQLRDQVRLAALKHLQEAASLFEQHTAEQLHRSALDASARQAQAAGLSANAHFPKSLEP